MGQFLPTESEKWIDYVVALVILRKQSSFALKISSVNVTKSAGFGRIKWRYS